MTTKNQTGRYEVRTINTGAFGDVIMRTDSAQDAKQAATEHCSDSYYGTAIIDTQTDTVDLGDRTVPVSQAFND